MRTTALLAFVGALSLSAVACSNSDSPVEPVAPSSPFGGTSAAITPDPSPMSPEFVSNWGCPSRPPLEARFHVTVQAGDNQRLRILGVRLRFQNVSGVQPAQITLPAPVPVIPFGSALVNARDRFMFPVNVGLGCGGIGRHGTIVILVDTRDDRGRDRSMETSVIVR